MLDGADPRNSTKALYAAIEAGNFPEWTLRIQTLDPADVEGLDFDPLDPTRIWPEADFPSIEVGRLVLNQTIQNFFAENEQAAFDPGNLVPGIQGSADKLLQARLFAYKDAQRYRIGSNFASLPINCPFMATKRANVYQFDGAMNADFFDSAINYFPSRVGGVQLAAASQLPDVSASQYAQQQAAAANGQPQYPVRQRTDLPIDDFLQPGQRIRSWDKARRDRFVQRFVGLLSGPNVTPDLRGVWTSLWAQADLTTGAAMAAKLTAKGYSVAYPPGSLLQQGSSSSSAAAAAGR